MFIEADVLYGFVTGGENETSGGGGPIPIMAHDPGSDSDLSLRDFLRRIVDKTKTGSKKGVKLDFKELEVVEDAYKLIQAVESEIDFPVWMNKDLLNGPGSSSSDETLLRTFLDVTKKYFPTSTLSIGWRSNGAIFTPPDEQRYTMEQMDTMIRYLNEAGVTQPVTYPVRALYVGASVEEFSYIFQEVPGSTLTIWSTLDEFEQSDVDSLRAALNTLGRENIYLDVPKELEERLNSSGTNFFIHNISILVALIFTSLVNFRI